MYATRRSAWRHSSRRSNSVDRLCGAREHATEFRALKARALQRLILVKYAAVDKREAAAGAHDERVQFVVAQGDQVVANMGADVCTKGSTRCSGWFAPPSRNELEWESADGGGGDVRVECVELA